jgi:hypothetical protein
MTTGFNDYLVEHFPTGQSTGDDLTNVTSIRVTRTGEAKNNTADIILDNINESFVADGEFKFKVDEVIKIYASNGNVDKNNSAHLIGTYTIINYSLAPDAASATLKCVDKTYNMLVKLWAGDKTDTPPNIIETVVQTVNEDGTSATPLTTSIASTDSSGGSFTNVDYFSTYKTAYEVISELSQPQYTGDDRSYIFWFDENDTFYWEYPNQTTSGTLTFGSDPVLTMKTDKTESDAISMVIYNAGADKDGNDVLGFYLDPEAGSIKNRMAYQPMTDISKLLKKKFTDAGTYGSLTNAAFTAELDSAAVARSEAIVRRVGQGLWESIVDVDGEKYSYGDLYTVDATDQGFPATPVRINRIVHVMNKNGWKTRLTLRQDPEAN